MWLFFRTLTVAPMNTVQISREREVSSVQPGEALGALLTLVALTRGRVVIVSPIVATTPLFSLLLSLVFLRGRETITVATVLGTIAVVVGTIAIALGR